MATRVRKRKTKQSWKRRRARKIRIIVACLFLVLVGIGVGVVFKAALPYKTIDLDDYFVISYDGFNTSGTAEVALNDDAVNRLLSDIKEEYENRLIHLETVEAEDYVKFRSSLTATVSPSEGLSNGSVVTLTCHYDKDLADKLKIDVDSYTQQVTVNSLVRATTISNDQLFQDVEVTFSGISPNLSMGVVNNSEHPFLKTVLYSVLDPKDTYADGDEIALLAVYDEDTATQMQYVVDPDATCVYTYVAQSTSHYVNHYSDISSSIIQEAISAGAAAFNNANEYGVRIFCEGHLVPVYINKQATFQWGTPRALSAYFKTVMPAEAGKLGNNYNDLDIIYECNLTQANGVSCPAYCVVRFSDFVINQNGSISYDFSAPKIMSASYYSARVKKNVVDSYVGKYDIEKVY